MASIESNGSKERMDERLERMHEIECRICDFNIDGVCKLDGQHIPKIGCAGGKEKPITNADRIRAMSDEELAEFFHDMVQDCGCNNVPCQQFCKAARSCELAWLNWLKKEVEGEADEDQT